MALWERFFYSSTTTEVPGDGVEQFDKNQTKKTEVREVSGTSKLSAHSQTSEQIVAYSSIAQDAHSQVQTTAVLIVEEETTLEQEATVPEQPEQPPSKRFSFKRLSFSRKPPSSDKLTLPTVQEHTRREHASSAAEKKEKLSRSDVRAKKSALKVRMLITGEPTGSTPAVSPVIAKPQLNKIKTQLSEPKTANKLIHELRRLPATSPSKAGEPVSGSPIHAVCLEFTDAEEESIHFSKLQSSNDTNGSRVFTFPGIASAPVDQLAILLNEMHVIELMRAPDLGLGQPGDGPGILAGAVPTPETVLRGVKEITPQLLALGFATGRAIMPDHTGIYPPTDRISVLTYWWGLEVLLPPPTIEYLSRVQSITSAVVNFLSAMALVNNGVREILPFVRYIAQFIEFEFNSIKSQNKGQGVVCAATWIMPAALVPRPWDFPEAPLPADKDEVGGKTDEIDLVSPLPNKSPKTPNKRSSSAPSLPKPRPVSSILDIVAKPSSPVPESGSSVKVPQPPTPAPRPTPSIPIQV